jgi:hypothetical protein
LSRVSIYCGANNVKILDAGFWILDEITKFITFVVFRKRPYNKLIISPGAVNGKVFIPAKDGISAFLQQASSIQQPASLRLKQKNLINAYKFVGLRPWLRYYLNLLFYNPAGP